MTAAQAETIGNELIIRINALGKTSSYFMNANDFEIRRLFADCTKLTQIDAYKGWAVKGMIHALCGEDAQMRYAFKNLQQLRGGKLDPAQIAAEDRMHFCSIAAQLFADLASPSSGFFATNFENAFYLASFPTLEKMLLEAEKMNLDISNIDPVLITSTKEITRIFAEDNFSETEAQAMLDEAGAVLRDAKILGTQLNIEIDEETFDAPRVIYSIGVPFDGEKTADLRFNLAERIAENIKRIPSCFYVTFQPMSCQ